MFNAARENIKELVKLACAIVYAGVASLLNRGPRGVVLYYHDVKAEKVKKFERQMDYLARSYMVVKPSEIKEMLKRGYSRVVALTFDDGLESIAKNALPVLSKNSLPAAVFVPTGNMGKKPLWYFEEGDSLYEETVLEEAEIVKLERNGLEIFSHGWSHCSLTDAIDDKLKTELWESKNLLEKVLGHQVNAISYPYGKCDARVAVNAGKAGYKLGFTTEPALVDGKTDDMQIGRFSVDPADSLLVFKLKIMGAYQVTRYLYAVKKFFVGRK